MLALNILAKLLQLLGFVRGAAAVWREHELRKKAKEVANAPTTKAELLDTLRKGDL